MLKALKKKPAERYPTVHALLDDIERHLSSPAGAGAAGQPLVPRPQVRRAQQARRLGECRGGRRARWRHAVFRAPGTTRPRPNRNAREQVEQFIASVLTDTGSAESLTAVGLLSQARARIDDEFADQPATQVRLLLIVSRSLIGFSEYDAADEALDAALTISRSHPGATDSYFRQARLQRLMLHRYRGRLVQSRDELRELRADMDRDGNWAPADRVRLLIEAAFAANLDANDAQAAVDMQAAADLALRELGPRHELTLDATSARSPMPERSQPVRRVGRGGRTGAGAHDRRIRTEPVAPQDSRRTDGSRHELPEQGTDPGRDARAAHGDRSRRRSGYPGTLCAGPRRSRLDFGGEPETALQALLRAESLARDSNNADAVILSQAMALRAYALASMGQMSPALEVLDKSLQRYAQEHGRDHPPTLAFRAVRATILAHLGRIAEARAELDEISAMKRNVLHWTLPHMSYARGVVERLAGNCDRALTLQREALQEIATESSTWLKRAKVLGEIGLCAPAEQKSRAVTSLSQALSLLREHQTRKHPATVSRSNYRQSWRA